MTTGRINQVTIVAPEASSAFAGGRRARLAARPAERCVTLAGPPGGTPPAQQRPAEARARRAGQSSFPP